jgi:TonB family protein
MAIPLKLTVYKGSDLALEQTFERDIVKIGRLASAHLKLDDAKVSRIHAVIESSAGGAEYSIIDMGSTEGTFLNGEKVSKEKLTDGDEIRLGDSRIVVSLSETSGAPAQAVSSRPPAPPSTPEDLWAASAQELQQAEPTMELGAANPYETVIPPMVESVVPQPMEAYAQPMQQPMMQMSAPPMQPMMQMPAQPMMQMPAQPMMQMPAQPMMQMPFQPVYEQPAYEAPPGMVVEQNPWGSVPNNLASEGVSDTERALEVKALWGGTTVLDTLAVTNEPTLTIGDEKKVAGWGPFQHVVHCDIEVPSKGLPAATYVLAESLGTGGANYVIHIPATFTGRLEKANGTMRTVEEMIQKRGKNIENGESPGGIKYQMQAEETLYLVHNAIVFQVRYVRRSRMIPPPLFERLNYTWLNVLVLAFFIHLMAIVSFIATPVTNAELTEDIFKNRNRFAQFRLTPEQVQKQKSLMLSKLKAGEPGAKAKGVEGKAGRKDYDKNKKQGRMAVKGDPNDKEIAKSTLDKLFGGKGNVGRSYLFGSGGLGGELKGALGGVTGAEIGDATGLGGLGTRGTGPGGGGLSMNSVGLGALGTHGRGGGQGGYGEGIGGLGKKAERDINISAGSPIIMGSLDKEIIRRVIKEHIAQIRYCYEKELVRNPGLFGKVATEFVISANGTVQSADVTQSTLGNPEAERCITAKIRTWQFPKPKGGGIVVVKYPFLFKTSG